MPASIPSVLLGPRLPTIKLFAALPQFKGDQPGLFVDHPLKTCFIFTLLSLLSLSMDLALNLSHKPIVQST